MDSPRIEMIPAKPVSSLEQTIRMPVSIVITPPSRHVGKERPPLNLSIVLDRSGSMAGDKKMPFAKKAAAMVVENLTARDRISVVAFDDVAELAVPSTRVEAKHRILGSIEGIHPRGGTDLHAGWLAGAGQVLGERFEVGVNRVILLSDGQANQGVTDLEAIASAVKEKASRGIQTTTIGVGRDYNEVLMERMAVEGEGQYYFVGDTVQLVDIFQTELQGLMATTGQEVTLRFLPRGSKVVEFPHSFNQTIDGAYRLPDLMAETPIRLLVVLEIPPPTEPGSLLDIELQWVDPETSAKGLLKSSLRALPAVAHAEWEAVPVDLEVEDDVVTHRLVLIQENVSRKLRERDISGARQDLDLWKQVLAQAPPSPVQEARAEAYGATMNAMDLEDFDFGAKFLGGSALRARRGRREAPDQDSK
ncbi:MAG: VWA domain-containing protein [Isosphaeraceae bacterium]|nr:VWA domain-containing protein [Isosphaeraceae bacterium]